MLVMLQIECFYSAENVLVGVADLKLNTASFPPFELGKDLLYLMLAFREELDETNTLWVYSRT